MEYIIVQAGGKGTRLGYLTKNKPKALVPVQNLPMLFYLFRKYPSKRFLIIADYKKEVLREYLSAFADVKYQVVEAEGTGTCSGIRRAIAHIPEGESFMLVWSDLILPDGLKLPEEYESGKSKAHEDYIGISTTFSCRWKYEKGIFSEEQSKEHGVAGFFLFSEKKKLKELPESGELVRWMQQKELKFQEISLEGTREFGLLEEYEKLGQEKCRPFNRITVQGEKLIKEPVDIQGETLAKRESAWYEKAKNLGIDILPKIYNIHPLEMEFIHGKNIYEYDLNYEQKQQILEKIVTSLNKLHQFETSVIDTFSIKETYFNKTFDRLFKIRDMIPFSNEKSIMVNGKRCRNAYHYKRELEKKLDELVLNSKEFSFIHGDCTFSNMMLRDNGEPVLIDPRGYFGFTELYGDIRYDWAKVYYSIVGNYDQFNLKRFRLDIGKTNEEGIKLKIESNHWEEMSDTFLKLTGVDEYEIKLLHAVIWLSLTTYAWQDYDSICGAFYNGLYYLEEVL